MRSCLFASREPYLLAKRLEQIILPMGDRMFYTTDKVYISNISQFNIFN